MLTDTQLRALKPRPLFVVLTTRRLASNHGQLHIGHARSHSMALLEYRVKLWWYRLRGFDGSVKIAPCRIDGCLVVIDNAY